MAGFAFDELKLLDSHTPPESDRSVNPSLDNPAEHQPSKAELRELNQQLIDKTQLLETTLTSISQGILLFDADKRVILFNARACELLDVPASFLAARLTLPVLHQFQAQRGDLVPMPVWWTATPGAIYFRVAKAWRHPPTCGPPRPAAPWKSKPKDCPAAAWCAP